LVLELLGEIEVLPLELVLVMLEARDLALEGPEGRGDGLALLGVAQRVLR
jgi:hypothetical protein